MLNDTFDPIKRRALILDWARGVAVLLNEFHQGCGGTPREIVLEEGTIEGVIDAYDRQLHAYKRRLRYKDRVFYDKIAVLTARAVMEVRPIYSDTGGASTLYALRANEILALRCFQALLGVDGADWSETLVEHLIHLFTEINDCDNAGLDALVALALQLSEKRSAYLGMPTAD